MAGKKRKSGGTGQMPPPKQHRFSLDADPSDSAFPPRNRSRAPRHHQSDEQVISSRISARIRQESLRQQREILEEAGADAAEVAIQLHDDNGVVEEEDKEDKGDDIDEFDGFETQSEYDGGVVEIDEADERILAAFMAKEAGPQLSLGDIIMKKIMEKDAEVSVEERAPVKLDNSIIELYKGVGNFLSRYTSGKIPKAFKHIPSLECWADVLELTEPAKWSPNAVYQATRIFSSNMNARRVQQFYEAVLLPRVRNDIKQKRRLHFALYQSLKKSLYKPAAFFKGVLLPLCRERNCTLREAVIIGSIIQKVTIPPLHSSAALMKLAEMEYCGTTSYFIKLFLDKKYALPYRVLDAVLEHFIGFRDDKRIMPVIWHQSLLAFVQRYKNELEKKDKDNLLHLVEHQKHYQVTPEIRRELKNSRNRGEKDEDLMSISSPVTVITKAIEEDRWDIPDVPMEQD